MDFELPSCSEESEYHISENLKWRAPPTICEVCLGKATGHHYDVASCNGCKSFFRRVFMGKLSYTCFLNNACFDDLKPGKPAPKCRSCRFEKCVKVGMNPLAIKSEERSKQERVIEKPRQTIDSQVGDLIDKMIRLDVQSEKFRDCTYNPHTFPTLRECVKQQSSMLSMADRYGPMQGWPLQKQEENLFFQTNGRKHHHPIIKRWIVYELFTEIELVKALPFFSDLSESDRYYLLQETLLMSSNLTKAFYSYEQKSDKLMRPDGIEYCVNKLVNHELRDRLQNDIGVRCLNAILQFGIDRVEFVLLRALVLINPAVPEISELARQYLTRERQKYNLALFRYIMAKHGASGPTRYANILGFIEILANQQRDHRNIHILVHLEKQPHHIIPIFHDVMKY